MLQVRLFKSHIFVNIFLSSLFVVFTTTFSFSQEASAPIVEFTEEDGSPSTYPYKVKLSNGSVTDNGDGTASITVGSGTTTGSGTTNYVSKWTSSTALGNSQIYDDGTSVGAGYSTAPPNKLSVKSTTAGDGISIDNAVTGEGIDSNTKILLHMNGSHASTTFTDSAPTPHTFTASGATITTAESVFGGASGAFVRASSQYVSTPDTTAVNFGTGNFTIDFWYKTSSLATEQRIFAQKTDDNNLFFIRQLSNNNIQFYVLIGGSTELAVPGPSSLSANTWYHIALIRGWSGSANSWVVTIDGTAGTPQTNSLTMPNLTGDVFVGRSNDGLQSNYVNGFIDEFRVSDSARWTTNFTRPSSEYGNAVNQSSLILKNAGTTKWTVQDNGATSDSFDIKDASGNVRMSINQSTGAVTFSALSTAGYVKNSSAGLLSSQAIPIPLTDGGCAGSSAVTCFDNISPMTTIGDLIQGGTAGSRVRIAAVATGNALISGGVGTASSWGKIGLTTHVSGVLPVANGGTNVSSASITAFNNITGYTASGATGTTSTNLVFSTSPTIVTPTIAKLANLTSNGFVKTSGGDGTLSVDTASYQTTDATLTSLAAYNTNGIVTQTAADTFTGRTITGTANEVTLTNGDGVSGNPTVSLPTSIDLGGKTSFEIPNGTAPVVDAAGEIALDTTGNQLLVGDSGNAAAVLGTKTQHKTFVLDTPTSTDVFPIWQFEHAVTITKVTGTIRGGTSFTFNIEERPGTTLNSSGTDVMTSDLAADQGGETTTTFSNASIAADAFLVLAASALSGTVNQVVIRIDYTVDRT